LLVIATWPLAPRHGSAADYPSPQQGDRVAPEVKFHTGEMLHGVRFHYTTVGARTGQPVLIIAITRSGIT